jgi:ABC-type branched-subunit amino acid transport system substrate-binding protein
LGGHNNKTKALLVELQNVTQEEAINNEGKYDIKSLKQNLYQVANSHFGITGNTTLNEAGDREYGTYDFCRINQKVDNTSYEWTH